MQPLSDGPTAEDVFEVPGSNLVHLPIQCVKEINLRRPHKAPKHGRGEKLKMSPLTMTPKFANWEFLESEIDSFQLYDLFKQRVGSPKSPSKIDEFEGDPVPIGWCTPFAGKRCRASWHRSFRNTWTCSELWTSESFTKYPV